MPDDLSAAVEATQGARVLRGWIKLAGTRSAEEIAAAIRAARAS